MVIILQVQHTKKSLEGILPTLAPCQGSGLQNGHLLGDATAGEHDCNAPSLLLGIKST